MEKSRFVDGVQERAFADTAIRLMQFVYGEGVERMEPLGKPRVDAVNGTDAADGESVTVSLRVSARERARLQREAERSGARTLSDHLKSKLLREASAASHSGASQAGGAGSVARANPSRRRERQELRELSQHVAALEAVVVELFSVLRRIDTNLSNFGILGLRFVSKEVDLASFDRTKRLQWLAKHVRGDDSP